jgi:hypothetical protein
MRRFYQLVFIGLKVTACLSAAFVLLWFVLSFIGIVLELWLSLKVPLFGRIVWIYSALLYPLITLSLPIGQIYAFLFCRRRQSGKAGSDSN